MCQYLPTANFIEIEVTERNKKNFRQSFLDAKGDNEHG